MYAVFCFKVSQADSKNPHFEPLDIGTFGEPNAKFLHRRGRVGLFATRADAETALRDTVTGCPDQWWVKDLAFRIIECVPRGE